MKTTDATVLDEPKTHEATADAVIEPAVESRARPATGVKDAKIYVDGKFYSEANAKVSVLDHGLLYGDGIFEGIRFYNGRVFRLEEHLNRLWDSARSICLEIPMTMRDMTDAGNVAECTADNVFVVKRGQIFTPPITAGALRGITRSIVFEIAAELGIKVSETDITRHDVFVADECFLTGTAAEIIPVVKADGRLIGNGKPGPITTRTMARFREMTRTTGTPVFA